MLPVFLWLLISLCCSGEDDGDDDFNDAVDAFYGEMHNCKLG